MKNFANTLNRYNKNKIKNTRKNYSTRKLQILPLGDGDRVTGLQRTRHFFVDGVPQPHILQLFVPFRAQSERVAAPQALVRLAVLVQIGRRQETAARRARQQQNFALADTQKDAGSGAADVGVVGAGADLKAENENPSD